MTIQRRPRPQLRRQLAALAAAGGVLYLVAVTAASPSARSALDTVGRQGELCRFPIQLRIQDRHFSPGVLQLAAVLGQVDNLCGCRCHLGSTLSVLFSIG